MLHLRALSTTGASHAKPGVRGDSLHEMVVQY
ncbi:hypothetical protein N783_17660 [Pontibacillus marinus BH030004 = DSM 16465]|uniref:Uncharacterized protein n=1 Tax=Pontibacillus marinus BH030004 = DSM 16465 TaxID=1385511 RepID=A0A0A5FZZ8_9BACI|nr:hypothetical protein N783_17660 [Pontibacillus marinus BH030004 = DSM 16465]